jgi:hypothetical protein
MKIIMFVVFSIFVASTAFALVGHMPQPSHASTAVKVLDAPQAPQATAIEAARPVQIAQLAPLAPVKARAKPAARSTRVYRCEVRQLQMGTYGDTVQDCYWHDR